MTRSSVHCLSPSGIGSRTARKPQAVRTSWFPSCIWQVWQVGAAAVSGIVLVRLSSLRTPCFDESYISHCGWSKPMWQVLHASGCRASAFENRWRVWQASQLATPYPPAVSLSSFASASLLRPSLWQPPQPFSPSRTASAW